jgi:hypothetical protein
MNWLRSRLRAWLGIDCWFSYRNTLQEVDELHKEMRDLRAELESFKTALKARAAESRQKPAYTDFESSQQAVLAEFEEKDGVHR